MDFFADFLSFLWQCFLHYRWFVSVLILEIIGMIDFFSPGLIERFFPKNQRRKTILLILLVGFPISTYWAYHDAKNETRALQQQLDRYKQAYDSIKNLKQHIFLAERYGGEWQSTNDVQIVFWRKEGQRDVLQKSYNPNLPESSAQWPRLTPFLIHQISGFVASDVTIYLKIPKEIVVNVLPGHIEPPPNYKWTLGANDSRWNHYYTTIPAGATEHIGSGVIQSLALKFPRPSIYPIEYVLSFRIMGFGDITGTFYLEIK